MKIIDSHLHFAKGEYYDRIARNSHHENTAAHLQGQFEKYHIVRGIVMGNGDLRTDQSRYPDFLSYCVGLDRGISDNPEKQWAAVEKHLQQPNCVGIKLYPGYQPFYVSDDRLAPLYELAEAYHKPVAIHTGMTALPAALLKYSHPLTLDEAAVKWPHVQFVLCHVGNPWIVDAVSVLKKNQNVTLDLSGLLEGKIPDMNRFLTEERAYIAYLRMWFVYLRSYDRILFGTDWPLANIGDYIALTQAIIPQAYWHAVFYDNAERIYQLNDKN